MTISFKNYVDITSTVAGNTSLPVTELITRIFTTNPLVPTGGVALEFTSASAVGAYFGTGSEEYARAVFYFGFISKTFSNPQKISFSRWANAATAPEIFGAELSFLNTTLAELNTITTGAFAMTIGGVTEQITGLDFSAAGSFAAVATILQTAIRAANVGTVWTAATVNYAATPGSFNFVGGATGVDAISVAAPASGTDVHTILGWATSALTYPFGPIFSNGVAIETITTTLSNSENLSDNFGSFLFTDTAALNQSQIVEAATWNLAENNEFMFLVQVTSSNATAISGALASIGGTAPTLQSPGAAATTEYPEMAPGMLMAATNYNLPNAVQNYMFQEFNLTPSVSDTSVALGYDAIGINYYGLTQTAGQQRAFYQRGFLTGAGVSTNATDMNVYANECWLKNASSAALGNLLVGSSQVPANQQGRSQIMSTLQGVINSAVTNGTISTGSFLSPVQINAVTTATNDPKAWYQVQDTGYWLGVVITQNEDLEYIAVYTLVYKKNDVIRFIQGTDVLI